MHVHRAVLDANETESGMTVHWVTEAPTRAVVFQAACSVSPNISLNRWPIGSRDWNTCITRAIAAYRRTRNFLMAHNDIPDGGASGNRDREVTEHC